MWKVSYLLLLIVGVFQAAAATEEKIEECDYYDSVDLGDSEMLPNGSYLYKDILIPNKFVEDFNYSITISNTKKTVKIYKRGCLCKIKSCVLLCCEPTKSMRNFVVDMILNDGSKAKVNVINEFVVQVKNAMSCDLLDDTNYDEQKLQNWKLFQNGTFYKLPDRAVLSKEHYCLVPHQINDENYTLVPQIQRSQVETHTELDMISAIKVISMFCLAIIITAYLYLPHFRTEYNRCCAFYFICLTISFLSLWGESLLRNHLLTSQLSCYFAGYFGYYFVMSTFLWLLSINYSSWKAIRNPRLYARVSIRQYHIFVWFTAAILLVITVFAEFWFYHNKDSLWRPGVAVYYCWMNTLSWSTMIYYHGPILLGIIINLTLSTITAQLIHRNNQANKRGLSNPETQTNLKHKSEFSTFFRIFAVAGIIWVFEIISYLFDLQVANVTFILDLITSSQGLILLFVTMWKKDVIKALYENFYAEELRKSKRITGLMK